MQSHSSAEQGLTYQEKRDLLHKFSELRLIFTAFMSYELREVDKHTRERNAIIKNWLTYGAGESFKENIITFDTELRKLLVECRAESKFENAVWGEPDYIEDEGKYFINNYKKLGLLHNETDPLSDFLDQYPTIASFLKDELMGEDKSKLSTANTAIVKMLQLLQGPKQYDFADKLLTHPEEKKTSAEQTNNDKGLTDKNPKKQSKPAFNTQKPTMTIYPHSEDKTPPLKLTPTQYSAAFFSAFQEANPLQKFINMSDGREYARVPLDSVKKEAEERLELIRKLTV